MHLSDDPGILEHAHFAWAGWNWSHHTNPVISTTVYMHAHCDLSCQAEGILASAHACCPVGTAQATPWYRAISQAEYSLMPACSTGSPQAPCCTCPMHTRPGTHGFWHRVPLTCPPLQHGKLALQVAVCSQQRNALSLCLHGNHLGRAGRGDAGGNFSIVSACAQTAYHRLDVGGSYCRELVPQA